MTRIRSASAALAAAALAVTLAGCGGGAQTTDTPPESTVTASTAPLEPGEAETPGDADATPMHGPLDDPDAEGEETGTDRIYRFGETASFTTGLQVTIEKPKKLTGSDYASEYPDQQLVTMKVTVKNGTGSRWDPANFSTTASTGDDEAEELFDSANGLEGSPSTVLLAGKSRSWLIGYAVTPGEDLVLEVSVDFESEPAVYAS